ncbi:MAG: glycerophosphodiester phosphodiesterase family protein [Terrimonas sp.]|nr:glycerophosphodiester phosphodiesterase family protein [Terrimonas sp.]OJY91645.1 MAG: hypothetical protein BGP13_07560 [Sphingobacteriales bacterium 40-81]
MNFLLHREILLIKYKVTNILFFLAGRKFQTFAIFALSIFHLHAQTGKTNPNQNYRLIAHRGGIVDSTNAENSLPAMQAAAKKGYSMVEIDLRLTKDSVLIIQHDASFKRYYGNDSLVTAMTWREISRLSSDKNNSKVLSFEEALQFCSGKLGVMIDNKIAGNDTVLFSKVIALLKKYNLDKNALMIGTEASTPFFTGKIKLSCTRKQLEENMQKPGYSPAHYYLFDANLTKEDVIWAKKNNIMAVGVVNEWRYKRTDAGKDEIQKDIQRLKDTGLRYFQIDSQYQPFF